jgi:hypothetical protein
MDNINRNIILLCPTCGGNTFNYSEDSENIKCISCGKSLTKDELIIENSENIEINKNEMAKEVMKIIKKEFKNLKLK